MLLFLAPLKVCLGLLMVTHQMMVTSASFVSRGGSVLAEGALTLVARPWPGE